MFSISEFSAIINPPQCAILAVGGGLTFIGKNNCITQESVLLACAGWGGLILYLIKM